MSRCLLRPIATPLPDIGKLTDVVERALFVGTVDRVGARWQQPKLRIVLENLLYRYYTIERQVALRRRRRWRAVGERPTCAPQEEYVKSAWLSKHDYFAHVDRQRESIRALITALVVPVAVGCARVGGRPSVG